MSDKCGVCGRAGSEVQAERDLLFDALAKMYSPDVVRRMFLGEVA